MPAHVRLRIGSQALKLHDARRNGAVSTRAITPLLLLLQYLLITQTASGTQRTARANSNSDRDRREVLWFLKGLKG